MNELSLYILDLTENSIHADSKLVKLKIIENDELDLLNVLISDDGRGMDKDTLKKVVDPFFTTRTTRKVGLGIPLFKELCELCEGSFNIDSVVGVGTNVDAKFKKSSIDLPPLGNIVDTVYALVTNEFNVELEFTYKKNDLEFVVSTIEIKEILDGVPLNEPMVMDWFKNYVTEGLQEIKAIK